MKKRILLIPIFISFILLFSACNDPVFYAISQEVEPIDPRIPGSTSNMVVFGNDMYVAQTRNLWRYNKGDGWRRERFSHGITQLAAGGGELHALFFQDSSSGISTFIKTSSDGLNWSSSNYTLNDSDKIIESIFIGGTNLYIGARSRTATDGRNPVRYLYVVTAPLSGNISTTPITGIGRLTGAAENFISTSNGIYSISGSTATPEPLTVGYNFLGIIYTGSIVIAIRENGTLYNASGGSWVTASLPDRNNATGALAIWENTDGDKLLLAGRSRTSGLNTGTASYGYLELALDASGNVTGTAFREPGETAPTTAENNSRYRSTIGIRAVNHILQAPAPIDPDRTLFASTQGRGLWSYRDHNNDGFYHWNAEY